MTAPILTEADVLDMRAAHGWAKETIRAVEAAVLAKLAAMNEPVASIYVSAGGAREFDDWRVPLPEGRNELFAHPPAAQDRVPIPTNEDQAAAMANIGIAWLTQHAPHRLRKELPAAQDREAKIGEA